MHDVAAQFNEFARTAPGLAAMGCCTCSSPHATPGVTVIELGAESDADLLAYEEFLTVVCCTLGKLYSSRTLSTCMCAPTVCPDLVFGKGMSPVATLAGRSTRYLMLVGLPGGNHQAGATRCRRPR